MSAISKTITVLILLTLFAGTAGSQTIQQKMLAGLEQMGGDDDFDFYDFPESKDKVEGAKSKWKALGLSIVLPGAGQYYTESRGKMIFFGGAETLIWSNFVGFRLYGKWKKEDYIGWAATHEFLDGAIPGYQVTFGPDHFAALLGAELRNAEGSSGTNWIIRGTL